MQPKLCRVCDEPAKGVCSVCKWPVCSRHKERRVVAMSLRTPNMPTDYYVCKTCAGEGF